MGAVKIVVWLEHRIRAFSVQPAQLEVLRARHPHLELCVVRSDAELQRELPDADAALVWSFDAAWYRLGPKLRFVGTPAAGREKLQPDPEGRVRAVHGHFHGKIMAESLLAMMLHFSRRLDVAVADQAARRYGREAYTGTRRLSGQQALIVGFGPLGRECGRLLKAVGLRVLGVRRTPSGDPAPAEAVHGVERLHSLLPEADHVILTLPSDTGTRHLMGATELALMRPSATLYNLGRGNAVDEAALVRALEGGQVGHAFLDVFEREPLPADSPLWHTKNLALMPHASAISAEYLDLWFEELETELASAKGGAS
jgi:phosphoglycerate dehydrogenase-like enzyme